MNCDAHLKSPTYVGVHHNPLNNYNKYGVDSVLVKQIGRFCVNSLICIDI